MKPSTLLLSCTAALLAIAGAAQAASDIEVTRKLQAAGYAEVRDVELDDGLWEAEVRRADGRWGEVVIDDATGEVFDAQAGRAVLDPAAITRALEAAGYTAITELERDGALFEAEARNAQGEAVELRVSGHAGRVLSVDADQDD